MWVTLFIFFYLIERMDFFDVFLEMYFEDKFHKLKNCERIILIFCFWYEKVFVHL